MKIYLFLVSRDKRENFKSFLTGDRLSWKGLHAGFHKNAGWPSNPELAKIDLQKLAMTWNEIPKLKIFPPHFKLSKLYHQTFEFQSLKYEVESQDFIFNFWFRNLTNLESIIFYKSEFATVRDFGIWFWNFTKNSVS